MDNFLSSALINDYARDVSSDIAKRCSVLDIFYKSKLVDEIQPNEWSYSLSRRSVASIVAKVIVDNVTINGIKLGFEGMRAGSGKSLYTKLEFLLRYMEKITAETTYHDDIITYQVIKFGQVADSKDACPKKMLNNSLLGSGKCLFNGENPCTYIHHSNYGLKNFPLFGAALSLEELPYLLYPEYIASLFLFGTLGKDEILLVSGLRRYSSFNYVRGIIDYRQLPPLEAQGRGIVDNIIRIGLMPVNSFKDQFLADHVIGNLRKYITAFIGIGEALGTDQKEPIAIAYDKCYDQTYTAAIVTAAASIADKYVLMEESYRALDMKIVDLIKFLISFDPKSGVDLKKAIFAT